MTKVLVVIADPALAPLPAEPLQRLARRRRTRLRWLGPGEAVELEAGDVPPGPLVEELGDALAGVPHDLALVSAAGGRVKRLLVSDMDSTMITVECIDELADLVGCKAEVAAITRRAMNGELDFRSALAARVRLLEGLDVAVLDEVWRTRVALMPGARTLIQTMRAAGARTVLVSGGFVPIVDRVAAAIGFDRAEANRLEVAGGRLTGRVLEPVRDAAHKLEVLREERTRLDLPAGATLAIGDGANDLPMIREAGLGVAFRAHPAVADAAGVAIRIGDLRAILYLQGIERSRFVG